MDIALTFGAISKAHKSLFYLIVFCLGVAINPTRIYIERLERA